MTDESHNFESSLRGQRATGLDPALLDRLESAADGTLTEMGPIEKQLEAQLRGIRPSPLPASLLEALEERTVGIAFPDTDSVVSFPVERGVRAPDRSWWRSAAAVAALGAFSALLLPSMSHKDGPQTAYTADSAPTTTQEIAPAPPHVTTLTPAEFTRKLSETTDEGVIWPSNKQPHRVLKVVYKDLVTMKRPDGTTYQVERPRVEYYIVPTDSD